MATTIRKIGKAVGIRNGQTPMPNQPRDLATITELFDRIAFANGGSAEIGGVWTTDREMLIAEVTAQIITFQTVNGRTVIDGVLDPTGGTLKLMNQLAAEPRPVPGGGITAATVDAPDGRTEIADGKGVFVADVSILAGSGMLGLTTATANYTRKLVRAEGSSITWFGVVVPKSIPGTVLHVNFTPTPILGGYQDSTYDSFGGWGQLWEDYTSVIGGQMAASGADQILVIPFFRNSQSQALGSFLTDWRDTLTAVVTAAIDSIDPFQLRDTYTFDRIVSSSFSSGFRPHQQFNTQAVGAAAMTDVIFDLDGVAGGSQWRPRNGVIYLNRPSPMGPSPVGGKLWYVGGRWGKAFPPLYGGVLNSHAACRNHLLYHGLWLHCT